MIVFPNVQDYNIGGSPKLQDYYMGEDSKLQDYHMGESNKMCLKPEPDSSLLHERKSQTSRLSHG